jgi:RHS repeat-associated protein
MDNASVYWDNIRVTTGGPGKIVAYDDFDPWGMILEGRSGNVGNADTRFKFTGKERDTETGYDYFGVRYFDARIARWMSVDPLAARTPMFNPYQYAKDNPLFFTDPTGMAELSFIIRTYIPYVFYPPIIPDARGTQLFAATYRTMQSVTIETDSKKRPGDPVIGSTGEIRPTVFLIPKPGGGLFSTQNTGSFGACGVRNGDQVLIGLSMSAATKALEFANWRIDYSFEIKVTPTKNGFKIELRFAHDAFPAYEIWVVDEGGNALNVYDEQPSGGLGSLDEPNDDVKGRKQRMFQTRKMPYSYDPWDGTQNYNKPEATEDELKP